MRWQDESWQPKSLTSRQPSSLRLKLPPRGGCWCESSGHGSSGVRNFSYGSSVMAAGTAPVQPGGETASASRTQGPSSKRRHDRPVPGCASTAAAGAASSFRRRPTAPPAAAEGGASLLWRRWRAKRRWRPTGMARAAGAAASASWGRGCRLRWRPWPGACRRWARRPSGGSSKVGPERGLPPARSRGSSCPGARRRPARGGPRRPAASLEEAVGPRRKARTAGGVCSPLLSSAVRGQGCSSPGRLFPAGS